MNYTDLKIQERHSQAVDKVLRRIIQHAPSVLFLSENKGIIKVDHIDIQPRGLSFNDNGTIEGTFLLPKTIINFNGKFLCSVDLTCTTLVKDWVKILRRWQREQDDIAAGYCVGLPIPRGTVLEISRGPRKGKIITARIDVSEDVEYVPTSSGVINKRILKIINPEYSEALKVAHAIDVVVNWNLKSEEKDKISIVNGSERVFKGRGSKINYKRPQKQYDVEEFASILAPKHLKREVK